MIILRRIREVTKGVIEYDIKTIISVLNNFEERHFREIRFFGATFRDTD